MKSPSEEQQVLVPRLVNHWRGKHLWHICMADQRFRNKAIVALEALCGHWCYGTLHYMRKTPTSPRYSKDHVCEACQDKFFVARR